MRKQFIKHDESKQKKKIVSQINKLFDIRMFSVALLVGNDNSDTSSYHLDSTCSVTAFLGLLPLMVQLWGICEDCERISPHVHPPHSFFVVVLIDMYI